MLTFKTLISGEVGLPLGMLQQDRYQLANASWLTFGADVINDVNKNLCNEDK